MKTKTRSADEKPPYGPNIVRAWFDTVIQPALHGLETEQSFLARKNWTFRFHPPSLEFIGPLREHLPSRAVENLDQFLSFFPAIGSSVGQHDRLVEALLAECRAFHAALAMSPRMREVYRRIAEDAPAKLGKDISRHFGAYSKETDFIGVLAELLVNNTPEQLPPHYSTAELWSRYRDWLTPIVQDGDPANHRQRAQRAGTKLLKAVNTLRDELRGTRSQLSLDFDVPYVAEAMAVR
jgi:hypothetical protein